jgi:glycerol-3-phosphate acyltransferase PlsX
MGGDHAPQEIVNGALEAAKTSEVEVVLVGDEARIREAMGTGQLGQTQLVHCAEVITNDEEPARAVKYKKDASIVVAARLLKEGRVDAVVTAGSTGALVASGLFVVGRLPGIKRPALAPTLPTVDGKGVMLLDIGATMDASPENLYQYAVMGSTYALRVQGKQNPRVGLLNVGAEEEKGNELAKAAHALLKTAPVNFIGNVEARNLLDGGVDVVVCDGFVGNTVLKFMEGMAGTIFGMLKEYMTADLRSKVGAVLVKPTLRNFKKRFDYAEYGGTALMGVNGVMIKCHGSSRARAITNGIAEAARCASQGWLAEMQAAAVIGQPNQHE